MCSSLLLMGTLLPLGFLYRGSLLLAFEMLLCPLNCIVELAELLSEGSGN